MVRERPSFKQARFLRCFGPGSSLAVCLCFVPRAKGYVDTVGLYPGYADASQLVSFSASTVLSDKYPLDSVHSFPSISFHSSRRTSGIPSARASSRTCSPRRSATAWWTASSSRARSSTSTSPCR